MLTGIKFQILSSFDAFNFHKMWCFPYAISLYVYLPYKASLGDCSRTVVSNLSQVMTPFDNKQVTCDPPPPHLHE